MPIDWHLTYADHGRTAGRSFTVAWDGEVQYTYHIRDVQQMPFSFVDIPTAFQDDVSVTACKECETARYTYTNKVGIAPLNGGGAPTNLAEFAAWKNLSAGGGDVSSMTISITASEVAASTTLVFKFTIQNPSAPTSPDIAPTAQITGVGIRNITMTRPISPLLWPVSVESIIFKKKEIVQTSPFPAATNTVTITLAVSANIAASCNVKIVITGLEGACFPSATSGGVVSISGAGATLFDHSQAAALAASNNSGVVHSRASWDAVNEELSFFVSGSGLTASSDYVIQFTIRNPPSAQSSPDISIEAFGIPIVRSAMDKNPKGIIPAGIFGSNPTEAKPLQIRGLSASSAFIEKKIGQSNANPGEANTLTMTLKINLPLTSADPASSISLSGLRGATAPNGPISLTINGNANSNIFSGKWHDGEKQLTLAVNTATAPGASYVVSFQVTNAKLPQPSPSIWIETSGIVIQPVTMDPATVGRLTTKNEIGTTVDTEEGATAPLFILAPRLIKRYVDQTGGSAWPAQSNIITFSFTPTVALKPVPGGKSAIIISGLEGVDLPSGTVWITGDDAAKVTDCAVLNTNSSSSGGCTPRQGTWNAVSKKLSLNLYSSVAAFQDISFKFNFTNSLVGQESPEIQIELTTDADAVISGLTLTEYNWTKQDGGDYTVSNAVLDQTFGSDMVQVAQKVVSGLVDKDILKNGNVLTKNKGLGLLYEGTLYIDTPGEYKFGVTGDDTSDLAVDGTVVAHRASYSWDVNAATGPHSTHTVMLGAGPHAFRARCLQNEGGLGVHAYWQTPGSSTFVEIPNSAFRVEVEDLQLAPAKFGVPTGVVGTDNVALLIYRSASFSVKSISQSTTAPGATNTITASFKPQFPLTGSKGSTITISGLLGSVTPDTTLTLLDAGALFNSTAQWAAKTGSLVLTVVPGQTVSATDNTIIKFDLDNPTIPQTGPSMIQISAMGDVPISAAAMVLGSGNNAPLKVIASVFTLAQIGQSSNAPAALNTITVTIQPGAILSKIRDSSITVVGVKGSATPSTEALPVSMSGGDAVVFSTPAPDLGISFSPNCKLENDQVLLLDDSETNFTDTLLYFNTPDSGPQNCSARWTKVKNYNVSTRCATLTVTSGSWSDGNSKCTDLGFVQSAKVLNGGMGYKSGAAIINQGATGSGLAATCNVDSATGQILSVSLSNKGSGYAADTQVSCPSACTTTSCGITDDGAEGGMVDLSVVQRSVAVSAGQWDQLTGSLVLNVHSELSLTAPTIFSFKVRNSLTPQGSSKVWVMAGGQSPIGSTMVNGTVMQIEGANSSATATCACSPAAGASSCACTANVTGLPTGRPVYALKAELQCNSATNVIVKVNDVAQSSDVVAQPPTTCKDRCQQYHTLFEWLNVASSVDANGKLPLKAEASTVGTDYCGGGDNLKVLFTLYY